MTKDDDARKAAGNVAETAGDFVVSLGRFSVAMGLFAARQAARLVTAPAKAAGSLEGVTDAASGQLSGVARTVFSVGANLQRGLVDAALDATGFGARGQSPSGDTSGLAFSLPTGASRRLTGIRTVNSGTLDRAVPQAELLERLLEYNREARSDGRDPERVVTRLWKSEGLATTVAKHLEPDNTLNDPALPREILPVIHVGFGSGSSEMHQFDAGKLHAVFGERCAPEYREFSYEGIGAILRAYERGFFKLSAGVLGFIALDAPDGPDPEEFFAGYLAQFPAPGPRLIAHGYGRILAFSTPDVYRAIREATKLPQERIEPAVHGIAFAFAMMNNSDLPVLLRESAVPFDREVRAAFQNGLVYALTFMDWFAPGILREWKPRAGLETELVEHARREAALSAERGFPLAFRLADPRS